LKNEQDYEQPLFRYLRMKTTVISSEVVIIADYVPTNCPSSIIMLNAEG